MLFIYISKVHNLLNSQEMSLLKTDKELQLYRAYGYETDTSPKIVAGYIKQHVQD